jgi:hypothetical protein
MGAPQIVEQYKKLLDGYMLASFQQATTYVKENFDTQDTTAKISVVAAAALASVVVFLMTGAFTATAIVRTIFNAVKVVLGAGLIGTTGYFAHTAVMKTWEDKDVCNLLGITPRSPGNGSPHDFEHVAGEPS